MERELSCDLLCEHCGSWFRSPLQFGYPEAFFDLAKETTTTTCPFCGNRSTYARERMRFRRRNSDGSVSIIGGETRF
ncbi:MAG TPA: hypothetical protein ENK47_06130 [Euryarchaeota archaeon]|nr:hypothetical protein [Euryarchaeota archaeon]